MKHAHLENIRTVFDKLPKLFAYLTDLLVTNLSDDYLNGFFV